jgi:2-polyprenyl-3-methyl-5-hydroxy-6-metoxy-1,4-benzoquinol methylase
MVSLSDLTQKILVKHVDPSTKSPEIILLGYHNEAVIGEHISRYILASKYAHGMVLDCAAGSCYGSSILKRSDAVNWVISVDVDKDLLKYGKIVYNASCVCAVAAHLPFREQCFDSVITIETIEHLKNYVRFIENISSCLKQGGIMFLTTPNKLYSSPFLPKPLNPYHINEYYLGSLLYLLKSRSFKVRFIYGGKKATRLELTRRIFGSLFKFSLDKLLLKPYLIDDLYLSISNSICQRDMKSKTLVDPDPSISIHIKLKATSNMVIYQYFVIIAYRA